MLSKRVARRHSQAYPTWKRSSREEERRKREEEERRNSLLFEGDLRRQFFIRSPVAMTLICTSVDDDEARVGQVFSGAESDRRSLADAVGDVSTVGALRRALLPNRGSSAEWLAQRTKTRLHRRVVAATLLPAALSVQSEWKAVGGGMVVRVKVVSTTPTTAVKGKKRSWQTSEARPRRGDPLRAYLGVRGKSRRRSSRNSSRRSSRRR